MITAALTLPRTSEMSIYSFLILWFFLAFFSGSYIWGNVGYFLLHLFTLAVNRRPVLLGYIVRLLAAFEPSS